MKKKIGGVMLALALVMASVMTCVAEAAVDQMAAEEAARIAVEQAAQEEAERLAAEEAEREAAEQAAAEEAEREAAERAAAEEAEREAAERAAAEESERLAAEEAERAAAEQAAAGEAENESTVLTEEETPAQEESDPVGEELLNLTEEEETETEDPEAETAELAEQETEITSEGYISIPGTVPEDDPTLHQIIDASEVSADISGFSIDISSYPAADLSENTRIIYQYLVSNMGMNHAAACGVLANIQLESGFNQFALGDGGTSYGICQWHNERFSRLMSYCGSLGLDYNTVEGQLAYLASELSSGYANVLNYLLSVPDTANGAYNAGYYWCVYFEAPSDVYSRAAQRGNLARYEYYPLDFSMQTEIVSNTETVSATTAEAVPDAEGIRQAAANVRKQMDMGQTETTPTETEPAGAKPEAYYLDAVADLRRKIEESQEEETGETGREVADRVRRLLDEENNAV